VETKEEAAALTVIRAAVEVSAAVTLPADTEATKEAAEALVVVSVAVLLMMTAPPVVAVAASLAT
jgi:hypothetical protein